ncbi:sugar phosphate isomerase/epimerase [Marinilongibacter aquaticus]|uniref:sugar phosphate isomerase/epimerase family protein n=1 Tax=Marinilongibacter aquaticus TaxID=2975157 RepID=UPI0021BD5A62|nr:sugar phosphate isomerase/epimerase [Marinilongibacter aquaticus]UBM60858.1 sugar phosphate isomerase/epimerase [Marinilongibacter aquaticus]
MKRKNFIQTLGLLGVSNAVAAAGVFQKGAEKKSDHALRVGVASYTLRKYSVDEVIEILQRLGVKDVCFKSFHLPYESSDEELRYISDKVRARGLNLYAGGVIYMKTPEDIDKYFHYAKTAGLGMIVGSPAHELLPQIEKKVKETNVRLAIHNHGPEDKVSPSPELVYSLIKNMDPRVGMCIDTGHTFRLGLDPATELKKYKDRLLDVHIKDIDEQVANGKNVEIGRGKMNIPSIMKALKDIQYSGVLGLEYEKDGDHAAYGLSESVGYVRGVIDLV